VNTNERRKTMDEGSDVSVIDDFRDDYAALSNFAPAWVWLEGRRYPSVEHAYQAAKTLDICKRAEIREARSAGEAKRLGQAVALRPDWDDARLGIMRRLLVQKFDQAKFAEVLLSTGDAQLIEGNDWGDVFWGVCRGSGKNYLGRMLMDIRHELRVARERFVAGGEAS
jgi:ribA/ribD-fused uncharacterized protein